MTVHRDTYLLILIDSVKSLFILTAPTLKKTTACSGTEGAETMAMCNECKDRKTVVCPECDGTGNRYYVAVLDIWESDCGSCFGSGVIACSACHLERPLVGLRPDAAASWSLPAPPA